MPLAGYCTLLHKMEHDWDYTPQQAEPDGLTSRAEDLDYNRVKMAAINMAIARMLWRGRLPRLTLRA